MRRRHGKLLADVSLFVTSLLTVCMQAGLLSAEDKALVTAHRFRHTVGKQLAERGAKPRTILQPRRTMVRSSILRQARTAPHCVSSSGRGSILSVSH